MSITPFAPKFMKVGVLTAALQELTPREVRDPDPAPPTPMDDEGMVATAVRELGGHVVQVQSLPPETNA